jgi:hypothetical protein
MFPKVYFLIGGTGAGGTGLRNSLKFRFNMQIYMRFLNKKSHPKVAFF